MSCAMLLCAMLFRANDQQYFAINAKLRNKDENMALSALKNQIKTIYLYSEIKSKSLACIDTFIVNDLIEEPRKKQKQDNG